MITIIIWAHYVLGLSVSVIGLPGGLVSFGQKDMAQILITWRPDYNGKVSPEVCLLDSADKIIFRSTSDELMLAEISSQERHPLQDIGTLWLRRACNTYVTTSLDAPLYSTLVHHVVAMALAATRRFVRGTTVTIKDSPETSTSDAFTIERWRIIDASKVLFSEIGVDMKQVDLFAKDISDEESLADSNRPRAMDLYLRGLGEEARLDGSRSLSLPGMTAMVLSIANITALEDCGQVPLVASISITEQLPITSKNLVH
ncbi:MAG: hypothetical protein LQ346_006284 [Caloplaca aetnensis]|nr:MAG: hypothetical protein LQ346_006284 [Caloplaca aetnensis]